MYVAINEMESKQLQKKLSLIFLLLCLFLIVYLNLYLLSGESGERRRPDICFSNGLETFNYKIYCENKCLDFDDKTAYIRQRS